MIFRRFQAYFDCNQNTISAIFNLLESFHFDSFCQPFFLKPRFFAAVCFCRFCLLALTREIARLIFMNELEIRHQICSLLVRFLEWRADLLACLRFLPRQPCLCWRKRLVGLEFCCFSFAICLMTLCLHLRHLILIS